MAVATATYKVGDTFTTQKSKVTGIITEINPQANGNVRVKLDVNGSSRYTTWTAKQSKQLFLSMNENCSTQPPNRKGNDPHGKSNYSKGSNTKGYQGT